MELLVVLAAVEVPALAPPDGVVPVAVAVVAPPPEAVVAAVAVCAAVVELELDVFARDVAELVVATFAA